MKFYAVKKGRNIGIYNTWDECKEQIHGYKGVDTSIFKNYKLIYLTILGFII
jgi:ribonuclease HI